jgi:hypothetical protein
MANGNKKEEVQQNKRATDSTLRALQDTVDSLPRTDHMTLPAVQITAIDDETIAKMRMISEINKAKNAEDVVNEEGLTLGQVRNQFLYGVTDANEEGAKHEVVVNETEDGRESVTIIAPVIEVTNADGEVEEVQDEPVVIEATPANIAPIDKDAPKDPVAAREAAGLNPDGSEGDPIGGPAAQPGVVKQSDANQNLGTLNKVGGGGTGSGTGGSGTGSTATGTGGTTGTSGTSGSGTGTSGTGGGTGGSGGTA